MRGICTDLTILTFRRSHVAKTFTCDQYYSKIFYANNILKVQSLFNFSPTLSVLYKFWKLNVFSSEIVLLLLLVYAKKLSIYTCDETLNGLNTSKQRVEHNLVIRHLISDFQTFVWNMIEFSSKRHEEQKLNIKKF